MFKRLVDDWVYGGFLAGLLLVALAPLFALVWPAGVFATWLQLPVYMMHQYEEHESDRFRRFINDHAAHGREALGRVAVFVINVPGVWGVIALATALAALLRPGLGLIAVYLVLVNALAHIGAAIALRRANPGLVTAIILFLPAGFWGLAVLNGAGATAPDHAIGLAAALAIHAAIVVHVRRRMA